MTRKEQHWPTIISRKESLSSGIWTRTTTLLGRVARRPWTLAMGRSEADFRSNLAPLVVLLAILLSAPPLCECKACKVEECWRDYHHELEEVTQSATAAYCAILRMHTECIRSTARGCRGNINYHTTLTAVHQWNNEYNCSHLLTASAKTPPSVTRPANTSRTPPPACAYQVRHPALVHCSLFGDPHLRTFSNVFQTCKVVGAWPLVDNAYVIVQVTNEAVFTGSSITATATTKVTILVKSSLPCTAQKMYEAQVDNVPSAFGDGTQSSGADKSVRIKEKEANAHVELHLRHVATTIVVRKVGRYLTVSVRMPKDVVHQGETVDSLQLCTRGCPAPERIDYQRALEQPQLFLPDMDREAAISARDRAAIICRQHNVTDFYFDSCVFDLMTTGDATFGDAAAKAFTDLRQLSPWLLKEHENRTHLLPPRTTVREPSASSSGSRGCRDTAKCAVLWVAVVVMLAVGLR